MSQHWYYADALKPTFQVLGYFYDVRLTDRLVSCRLVLDIIDRELLVDADDDISNRRPDVFVLMMNPGGSRPRWKSHMPVQLLSWDDLPAQLSLVETRPDTTQYQIMRVMLARGYRHARILNLSDLRNAKSNAFLADVASLEAATAHAHSIWAAGREGLREHLMLRHTGVPVIVGCGQDEQLNELADLCLPHLESWHLTGVTGDNNHPLLKKHPSPQRQSGKLAWLEDYMAQS